MNDVPKISQAEWEVMKVLWGHSPQTANDVVAVLAGVTTWSDRTVRTLLGRLVRKGALGFEEKGREYHYYPLVGQDECVKAEARSFLRRMRGVGLRPALATFLEDGGLSQGEVAELRRLLDGKASDSN